jgi:eukaryotic-like serine/threonine-protein kinase
MLGRYALYEKIASGGMASVHIGRLLGPVGFARTVAIKHMHAQYAEDPEFVSMFLDEARLAARIRHPNVVPTLDVVAMSGELFLVMEFVQGESLSRLMQSARDRGERIPVDVAAAIVVGTLLGLHAAHEAKSDRGEALEIVHRDVSPHNILVGIDGVARVLDFGVAKAVGRLHTTREGQLKGKLTYMAPEQLQGEATRATDVYATSIVLWEALTGKRLFDGANERQVVGKLIKGCEEPPSKHVAGLASAVDDVTMRGLSMDPAKRFATARDMARALEAVIPLATPSKVGDWVELAATDTLHERSVRVARIENDSSTIRESLKSIALRSLSPKEAFAPSSGGRTAGVGVDDMVTAPLSGSSVSALRRAPFLEARRRAALAAGVGGLALVIALAALASRHSARSSASGGTPATIASAVTSAAPSPVSSPSPSAVTSAAPSADPSAVTSAEPVASARSPSPAAPRPTAVVPRRGGVPSEQSPPATPRPAKRTTSKDDNTIF